MCILQISSATGSFKAYAGRSSIPVDMVVDADDIRVHRTGEPFGVFRIAFVVSDREWDDFPGQVEDAIAFLTRHAADIRGLIDSHDVSDAYLDFPIWSRIESPIVQPNERHLVCQIDHLPRSLISLCASAGLGIEMTTYARCAIDPTACDDDESG